MSAGERLALTAAEQQLPEATCGFHGPLVETLVELVSDLKWFNRIGKWLLCTIGAAVVLLLPLAVSFLLHVQHLETRLSVIASQGEALTLKQSACEEVVKKHGELPGHGDSVRAQAVISARLDALQAAFDELRRRAERNDVGEARKGGK